MPVVTGYVTAVFSGVLLVIAQVRPSGSTRFLDFNSIGSIIYYHGDHAAKFSTAQALCKSLGGRLPVSLEEISDFLDLNSVKSDEFWLGPVKQIGSVAYKWPDGREVNRYHFYYKKYVPQAPNVATCNEICCAITGQVLTQGQMTKKIIVKPFEEVPCDAERNTFCVITSPLGNIIRVVNESLKEFHTGYNRITKKTIAFDDDKKKLKSHFGSFKKDLSHERSKQLLFEITNDLGYYSDSLEETSDELKKDFVFINEENGRKFYFDGNTGTFSQATNACNTINGSLPVIKNSSDAQFILKLVGWFRFTWLASVRKGPLIYSWQDGSPVNVTFKNGFPKCQGSCCQLALYSADLVDFDCYNHGMIVCDLTPKKDTKNETESPELNEKISTLKKALSEQRKTISQLVTSFRKFASNAPVPDKSLFEY